jgi:hypothetical protein
MEFRSYSWFKQTQGEDVCAHCRRLPMVAYMVVWLKFIHSIARKGCDVPKFSYPMELCIEYGPGVPFFIADCGCISCSARKVLRISSKRPPSAVPMYHPNQGLDRLTRKN